MTFFEIFGKGRTPSASPEIMDSYVTGRTTIPKFIKRTEVKTILPDSSVKQITDDILGSFGEASESYGVMFIKEVN
jgi:nitrogen regulatory protein PII